MWSNRSSSRSGSRSHRCSMLCIAMRDVPVQDVRDVSHRHGGLLEDLASAAKGNWLTHDGTSVLRDFRRFVVKQRKN